MDCIETIRDMISNLDIGEHNLYMYGSHVYGTADDNSDNDLIIVRKTMTDAKREVAIDQPRVDITYYSASEFMNQLAYEHEISALECVFLPEEFVLRQDIEFMFELDMERLRRSLSQKSSNSWVKAKKKIDLHQEYRLGMKSLFHAFRILEFGIQIARHGRIVDYSAANRVWQQVREQNFTSWRDYKEYWQPKYNSLRSEFRIAAPITSEGRV
jgi:predicted nucleotidyltransferase